MRRWLLAAMVVVPALAGADPVLDRDPANYFALGMRSTRLKDLYLHQPGCNVGTNCGQPGDLPSCGTLRARGATIETPGQLAADKLCATGSFFQVFENKPGKCEPTCATCTFRFATPILGDLDGDGTPSCGGPCLTDLGDVARACDPSGSIPVPFPPCDVAKPLMVQLDQDCPSPAGDFSPGNMQCDLPAGVYGKIHVLRGARLEFQPGATTVACHLVADPATRIRSQGPANVLIPRTGKVRLNNFGDHGNGCGTLRIVAEQGTIRLGKYSDVSLDACALAGKMKLGRSNNLRGHYLGNSVVGDVANDGMCCGGTCGNGVLNGSAGGAMAEQCDGSASGGDAACPGLCIPPGLPGECTCGSPTTTTTTTTSTTVPSTGSLPTSTTTTSSTSTSTITTTSTTTSTTTTSTSTTTSTVDPGTTTTTTLATTTTTTTVTTTTATTTSTTTTTVTTTSTTSTTLVSTTTTSTTTSVTTTTRPHGHWTRTAGFYKNHPAITQSILTGAGGLTVCGHSITDVDVDHAHSAVEGLCVSPQGNSRLQLVRQLITAALTNALGGAVFPDLTRCNAVCANPLSAQLDVNTCVNQADAFNNSGDNLQAPFDPPGSADTAPCQAAHGTACTVLNPGACAAP